MSVVLCYVSHLISIMVTDTRISYGYSPTDIFHYTDNNEKLVELPIGWFAGAGVSDFLDYMRDGLLLEPVNNINDVIDIYNKGRKKINEDARYSKEDIDITAGLVSYLGIREEEEIPSFKTIILSKNLISGYNYGVINKEEIYILYPGNYIRNNILIENLKSKFSLKYKFDGDVVKLIKYMLIIFKEISDNAESVSEICDIGLMAIDEKGFHKMRIKDNINILLEDIDNGKISSHIRIIKS